MGLGIRKVLNFLIDTKNTDKSSLREMVYLGDYRAITRTAWGHKIFLDTRDISLTPHILLDGFWEAWITKVFMETVQAGMTVLEVGTNVGYYTLLAASKVGDNGKLYAFEANPKIFEILFQNISINGFLDRVTLVNKAVFSESKKMKFHTLKKNMGSSSIIDFSQEFLEQYMEEAETIEVEAISLDEFFNKQPPKVDLIKIDAEGSEPYIFRGMKSVINCNPQLTIICEFAPHLISDAGVEPRTFLEEVTSYGFRLRKINTDSSLVSVSIDELIQNHHSELFLTR